MERPIQILLLELLLSLRQLSEQLGEILESVVKFLHFLEDDQSLLQLGDSAFRTQLFGPFNFPFGLVLLLEEKTHLLSEYLLSRVLFLLELIEHRIVLCNHLLLIGASNLLILSLEFQRSYLLVVRVDFSVEFLEFEVRGDFVTLDFQPRENRLNFLLLLMTQKLQLGNLVSLTLKLLEVVQDHRLVRGVLGTRIKPVHFHFLQSFVVGQSVVVIPLVFLSLHLSNGLEVDEFPHWVQPVFHANVILLLLSLELVLEALSENRQLLEGFFARHFLEMLAETPGGPEILSDTDSSRVSKDDLAWELLRNGAGSVEEPRPVSSFLIN